MITNPQVWAFLLFVPVLFYSSAMQGVLLFDDEYPEVNQYIIEPTEENASWLLAAPGMPMLVDISNDLQQKSAHHMISMRFKIFRRFTKDMIQQWKPYEKMARGWLPDDILVLWGNIGIPSYYLPDLNVIDRHGLTDATIARAPVTRPNREREIAHDRQAPWDTLISEGSICLYTLRPSMKKMH